MTDRRRKPTSTATQPTKTRSTSRLSASTHKQTHGTHYAAVEAIKDALHAANYRCTGEANGTLEAYIGPGVVPVILVQTYSNDDGVEVWMPVTQSNKTADTVLALQVATYPASDPNADITARHEQTKQPIAALAALQRIAALATGELETTDDADNIHRTTLSLICLEANNTLTAFTSNTWTPPNAEAFLTLRPEMGTVTAPCGCLMEPAGDDPDPDSVAFYMCETHERAARALELLKVIADFWGSDQCDAPIWPGAYLTEKDEPIRFVIRDFVYPTPTQSAAASTVYDLDELRRKLAPKEGQQ